MTIDIYNDTNAPEQLHWHGQKIPPRRRRHSAGANEWSVRRGAAQGSLANEKCWL